MDNLIADIETLERYNVPTGVICKLITKVCELAENDKKILEIHKAKIVSLVSQLAEVQREKI
jgi:hypothetical protein